MKSSALAKHVCHLVSVVRLVVLSPRQCWTALAHEHNKPQKIALGIIGPLALLAAMTKALGLSLVGIHVPYWGVWHPPGVFASLVYQLLSVAMFMALLFADAWVVQRLAPSFQREVSYDGAFTLVAYSSIPIFLSKMLRIVPILAPLEVIGFLYAFAILFYGIDSMAQKTRAVHEVSALEQRASFFGALAAVFIIIHAMGQLIVPALEPSAFINIGEISQ